MSSEIKEKPLALAALKSEQCMKHDCPQDMESVWLIMKQEPLEEELPVQDIQRESPQVKEDNNVDNNMLTLKVEPKDEFHIEDHCISPGERSDEALTSSGEDVSNGGTSVSADVPLQSSLTSTSKAECHNFRMTVSEDHGTVEKYKGIKAMASQYSLGALTPHNVPDIYKTIDTISAIQKEVSGDTVKAYYSCSNCGKCFTLHSEMLQHLKIHSEKINKCTECGKCFSHHSKLKTHLNIHFGEKVYICAVCGEGFAQSGTLRTHLKIHNDKKDHKCPECGKCFTKGSTLRTHLKIHSGEKDHKCEECGKCFIRSFALKTHLKMHAGVKDHKCSECGKCFTQRIHLRRHLKTHSGAKDN